jgi:hypothetical protein
MLVSEVHRLGSHGHPRIDCANIVAASLTRRARTGNARRGVQIARGRAVVGERSASPDGQASMPDRAVK